MQTRAPVQELGRLLLVDLLQGSEQAPLRRQCQTLSRVLGRGLKRVLLRDEG
jgi:hypothetical protein